ncbi:SSS sodium solute transporter superfamily [Rhodopirellula maiorica SM1]|uniref:SSS sodium solute transporter superfamily n=2 Tax=Novipirellula TaxID=2795426 RepID=M5RU25_9BACT|nr:SSS sodium solute transporter superfamily [Rhodopirellula maiorica SM1]
MVIGLFMGVLGGLFILGALSHRANATGALTGAVFGGGMMFYLWKFTAINGYLYTASGIGTCVVVGYIASRLSSSNHSQVEGLTIDAMEPVARQETAP